MMAKNEMAPAQKYSQRPSSVPDEEIFAEIEVVMEPEELLAAAADRLERRKGPRANKHYRLLANEIRALAARI